MARGKDRKDSKLKWVIMLYIAADSTLANFAVESLKQINNSIGAPSGPDDLATVVVAAQFALDAPAGQVVPRYIFDEHSGGSIRNSLRQPLNAPPNMTEQEALISFLQWVYKQKECSDGDNFALILWGHGPELLLQPPPAEDPNNPGGPKHTSASLYLTPEELRVALEQGLRGKKPLDIIAFDACSMSMFEAAYEVRECAQYMVASQEEVPDLSFPYDTLVGLFRAHGDNPKALLHEGVTAYVSAYQDYICGPITGMTPATLAALDLSACDDLRDALCSLSCAFLNARLAPSLPSLLLGAREDSRSFVAGLYVDLYDFCSNLLTQLKVVQTQVTQKERKALSGQVATKSAWISPIMDACEQVIKALEASGLVRENSSIDSSCNGVSIYFPYISSDEYVVINQPTVKGGPDTIGKGFSTVLNSAASTLLLCVRRNLIDETEGYYEDLRLSADTDWYRFIMEVWTKILIDDSPDDLNVVYSAQQSAVNAGIVIGKLEKGKLGGCTCHRAQAKNADGKHDRPQG